MAEIDRLAVLDVVGVLLRPGVHVTVCVTLRVGVIVAETVAVAVVDLVVDRL